MPFSVALIEQRLTLKFLMWSFKDYIYYRAKHLFQSTQQVKRIKPRFISLNHFRCVLDFLIIKVASCSGLMVTSLSGFVPVCPLTFAFVFSLVCLCDSSARCLIMSCCCVFLWTLCGARGYLSKGLPGGWLDTRPQLFIRPPTGFCVLAHIWMCVKVYVYITTKVKKPC